LEGWLGAKGLKPGAVVTPQIVYELGADWYATRLDLHWERASAAEASATFERHGLAGPFWSLA
jgi:hypothetical protein